MNSKAKKVVMTALMVCLGWVSCAFSQAADAAATGPVAKNPEAPRAFQGDWSRNLCDH